MKKIILFAIIGLIGPSVFAQYQASNWFFGENAGISFDLDTNTIVKSFDGQLNTREGCSSISDEDGNLLFYTDGVYVWNKNHTIMPNGFGLNGDSSSTQSGLIVPKPGDPDIYYIFTVDTFLTGAGDGINNGLNYSEVDMTLNGGLGDIVNKNVQLLEICSEKITAVLKDCVTEAIWVVTFASENGRDAFYDTFHAFEVTTLGVNPTSVKSVFNTGVTDVRGYLKLSPDGTKVACANAVDGLYIYDFETALGTLSNERRLSINSRNDGIFPYGVEFSPNSRLLYVHSSNDFFDFSDPSNNNDPSNHASTLTQFDLSEFDVQSTEVTIETRQLFRGALQLGPDGKIYRALSTSYSLGQSYLGVIENPNIVGSGCNYNHNAINLTPFNSSQGLPPFIASFFNTEIDIIKNGVSSINLELCDGDTYTLVSEDIAGATYVWTLDGTPLTDTNFDLEVTQEGHYEVYIEPNNGDCAIEGSAFVFYNTNPDAFNHTILQCDEDGTVDGFTLFNLNEANENLTGNVAGLSTRFYTDAARTNEVDGNSFYNTVNPQTIYVDVINDATGCLSFSELILDVSITDSNDTVLPAVCDDDGTEDGLHVFNLSDADSAVVSGLPTGLEIAYYETYDNALLEQNNLGTTFTNTVPYSQTIYARVENANNCYGISEVVLNVNTLPDIVTEDLDYYCINFFPTPISINAGVLNDSPNNYTYNWSTGENTYEINVNESGAYTVTVTNSNGCSKQRTVTIENSNLASFQEINVVDVTENNTITVLVTGEGIYEYSLINENNEVIANFQENNVFENVLPGIYTVAVRDIKNNCGTVDEQVSVIGFPKFFTPNNDGVHDTWQVYGISSMFQPNTKILIFNRFGKLVKELNPIGEGWDGLFNGAKLPTDDYWFSVKLQDGRVFKNHFTLKY